MVQPRTCRHRAGVLVSLVVLTAGCGGSDRPETFPVQGTVTYRGALVADASVQFIPKTSRPATAMTDASGSFQLRTFEQADGAVEGEHVVVITKNELVDPNDKSSYPARRSVLPAQYASAKTSPLRATVVPGGDNKFDFNLTDR